MIIVSILTVNIKLPALINCIGMHESFLLAAVSHKIMYHISMMQAWTPPYTCSINYLSISLYSGTWPFINLQLILQNVTTKFMFQSISRL